MERIKETLGNTLISQNVSGECALLYINDMPGFPETTEHILVVREQDNDIFVDRFTYGGTSSISSEYLFADNSVAQEGENSDD